MEADRTKILCVGFPKSGTTTLYKALKKAGFDATHRKRPGEPPAGYTLYRSYVKNGTWQGDDVITQLDTCRKGINTWPQLDYGFLRWANKQAKLILQIRDPEKVLRSIKNHNDLRDRIAYAPGLSGEYTTDEEIIAWIESHYRMAPKLVPNLLTIRIDDEDAPNQIADYLGVEIPWWGVANATRRAAVRETG